MVQSKKKIVKKLECSITPQSLQLKKKILTSKEDSPSKVYSRKQNFLFINLFWKDLLKIHLCYQDTE